MKTLTLFIITVFLFIMVSLLPNCYQVDSVLKPVPTFSIDQCIIHSDYAGFRLENRKSKTMKIDDVSGRTAIVISLGDNKKHTRGLWELRDYTVVPCGEQ